MAMEQEDKKERTQAAARVITEHRASSQMARNGYCRCEVEWSPLHVAEMLDKAGLLRVVGGWLA